MRPASAGDTNSNSMPKLFARAICRLHQRQPLGRRRDVQRSALRPAGREAGLLLERRIELDAVAAHARRVARRARLADEPRGVPGRAAGEPALLEQHDVAHSRASSGGTRSSSRRCRRRRRRRARARESRVMASCSCRQSRNAATPAATPTAPASRRQPKLSLRNQRAHQRSEHDRDFAQRRDDRDRRKRHRPQHDRVRADARGAAERAAAPARAACSRRRAGRASTAPTRGSGSLRGTTARSRTTTGCRRRARPRRRSACRSR